MADQSHPSTGLTFVTIKVVLQLASTAALWCLLFAPHVDGGTEEEILKALEETQEEVAWRYIPLSGPSFDPQHTANVSAQVGTTAMLNCRIKYLGGKMVSWMRARDLHLLTVGRFTYTSDDRFRSVHQTGSDDWLLKIYYVQHRDAGAYQCQVSTTPPLSATVWLTVAAEPETRVLGGADLYINSGSTINLTCVVKHSPKPPPYIRWFHENQELSYDSSRGGVTVVTNLGEVSTSRLLIQRAVPSDAGRYTCRPAKAEPHHVTLHVLPNEHPAAIHHKNGTSGASALLPSSPFPSCLLTLLLLLLTLCDCFRGWRIPWGHRGTRRGRTRDLTSRCGGSRDVAIATRHRQHLRLLTFISFSCRRCRWVVVCEWKDSCRSGCRGRESRVVLCQWEDSCWSGCRARESRVVLCQWEDSCRSGCRARESRVVLCQWEDSCWSGCRAGESRVVVTKVVISELLEAEVGTLYLSPSWNFYVSCTTTTPTTTPGPLSCRSGNDLCPFLSVKNEAKTFLSSPIPLVLYSEADCYSRMPCSKVSVVHKCSDFQCYVCSSEDDLQTLSSDQVKC